MKVICVKRFTEPQEGMENAPRPEVGDEDVVLKTHRHQQRLYYILERFDKDNGYRADHFAVLPDSSADEMADESREAIVNLETVLV